MKLLIIIPLFAALICQAQNTNHVTTKVFERDYNKDGKPDFRIETVFRGGERVMVVWSKPNAQGVLTVTSRAYYASGNLVMFESDEDHDGSFKTLAVYRPGTGEMEVFTHQRDGSVQPVSAQKLQAFRKENAEITQFWPSHSVKTWMRLRTLSRSCKRSLMPKRRISVKKSLDTIPPSKGYY